MSVRPTNDLSDFGRHAPRGWLAGALRVARGCGPDWIGKRLAFALRTIAMRALADRPLDVEAVGARMRLYPGNNVAEKNLLFTPQYFDPDERRFLAARLPRDCVFIDVGANVGGYALFVAALAGPAARILAIEPQPEIFERLVFNIRQNAFATVKAIDCAVSDRDGPITLFVDDRNRSASSMRMVGTRGDAGALRVPAKTLAAILAEEGFERVDALKLDVAGAADIVLEAFFRDVDTALWPRWLIVEDLRQRWSIDLPGLIAAAGYGVALRTRTNVVYER